MTDKMDKKFIKSNLNYSILSHNNIHPFTCWISWGNVKFFSIIPAHFDGIVSKNLFLKEGKDPPV